MKINKFFIAVDGDSIGKILEKHILSGDMKELSSFSQSLQQDIDYISDGLLRLNGEIYMKGGDNLLGLIDASSVSVAISVVCEMNQKRNYHFSIGIASNSAESFIALKYAKLNKKDVVFYSNEHGFTDTLINNK